MDSVKGSVTLSQNVNVREDIKASMFNLDEQVRAIRRNLK